MIKHALMLYILVICLFSAVVQAAKPIDCSDSPFCYRILIYHNDAVHGMDISWPQEKGRKDIPMAYQTVIYDFVDEYIGTGRYKAGDCFKFYIDYPRYGYQPFWNYGWMPPNMILDGPHSQQLPECE